MKCSKFVSSSQLHFWVPTISERKTFAGFVRVPRGTQHLFNVSFRICKIQQQCNKLTVFDWVGATELASVLGKLSTLEKLDLGGKNNIGGESRRTHESCHTHKWVMSCMRITCHVDMHKC